jgi:5-methylthioadenosine/S-adenosylhomocysteine deaminase
MKMTTHPSSIARPESSGVRRRGGRRARRRDVRYDVLSVIRYLCAAIILWASLAFLIVQPASAQAKEKTDLVATHGTVVTMGPDRRIIEDGAVAIRADSILAVGKSAEIESRYDASKIIDAHGGIIMPGLINTHAHAGMSLFRGIADDLSLDEWLNKYIFPAEARNVTEDFVVWATRLSLLEMMRGGTTTYCDMYYFEDAVARVTKEAGMRGVLAETIIDFPAPDNKTLPQAYDYTQKFLDHWKGDPLITAAVGPHSIYTLSEKTLQDSAALARRNQAPIAIHIAEAPFELQLSREKHGATPVAYLERIGLLGPDVIGAHCIWVDSADIAILTHFGVGCSHNPSSNMKTAAGVMPVVDMLAAGQAIGLATDGAASNNNQDMFEEMDLAAKLQKIARRDPRALPAPQVVELATIGGARALHLEKQIGSLEVGKKADLIVVATGAPHDVPMYNVYSSIVYAQKAADVRTVVIAGKIVMEDRRILTLDEPQILAKVEEYKKKVAASLAAPAAK